MCIEDINHKVWINLYVWVMFATPFFIPWLKENIWVLNFSWPAYLLVKHALDQTTFNYILSFSSALLDIIIIQKRKPKKQNKKEQKWYHSFIMVCFRWDCSKSDCFLLHHPTYKWIHEVFPLKIQNLIELCSAIIILCIQMSLTTGIFTHYNKVYLCSCYYFVCVGQHHCNTTHWA